MALSSTCACKSISELSDMALNHRPCFISMAGSTVFKVVYGIDVKDNDDPRIQIAEEAMKVVSVVARTGAYLGEYLFLHHLSVR